MCITYHLHWLWASVSTVHPLFKYKKKSLILQNWFFYICFLFYIRYYNYSTEEVINALLEVNLPPSLVTLDRTAPAQIEEPTPPQPSLAEDETQVLHFLCWMCARCLTDTSSSASRHLLDISHVQWNLKSFKTPINHYEQSTWHYSHHNNHK